MLIVVPLMSIAAAILTVQWGLDGGWPIPAALLQPVILPDWIYAIAGLAWLLTKIFSVNYLLAYIVISFVYMLLLGGVVSVIYAVFHGMAGPPRYGPLDAKPIKSKPYKR
jgi:hypothetical protein